MMKHHVKFLIRRKPDDKSIRLLNLCSWMYFSTYFRYKTVGLYMLTPFYKSTFNSSGASNFNVRKNGLLKTN